MNSTTIPSFSRQSPEWLKDNVAVIRELHDGDHWLARSETGLEFLSYDRVRNLLRGKEFAPGIANAFRIGNVPKHVDIFVEDGLLPAIDGDRHKRIRKILLDALTLRQVDTQRGLMQKIANRLLDPMVRNGGGDFVGEFTHRYPIEVVSEIIGVPVEDIPIFEEWTIAIGHLGDPPIGSGFPQADAAIGAMVDYLRDLVTKRRKDPRPDLLTALIEANDRDREITENELLYNMVNLLMAGHDTTRFQMAWAILLLTRHPDQFEALRKNHNLVPNAIAEAMRVRPANRRTFRLPRAPMEIDGFKFEPTDLLVANIEAANLDPKKFPKPEEFDIRRENAGDHLTFGHGPHLCAGASISRVEMAEAMKVFITRIKHFDIVKDPSFVANSSIFSGPNTLDLAFREAA